MSAKNILRQRQVDVRIVEGIYQMASVQNEDRDELEEYHPEQKHERQRKGAHRRDFAGADACAGIERQRLDYTGAPTAGLSYLVSRSGPLLHYSGPPIGSEKAIQPMNRSTSRRWTGQRFYAQEPAGDENGLLESTPAAISGSAARQLHRALVSLTMNSQRC
jgi:hypothetical protein